MQPKSFQNKNIEMLQGYYNFLYLGKFLETVITENDLSKYATDLKIPTGQHKSFVLKGNKIQQILSNIYKHSDKKNVFGFISELSVFKGIFGIMREIIENDEIFDSFMQKKLKDQYFPFEQIIKFSRNVLTHSLDSNVSIKKEDFQKQKDFLESQTKQKINLKFNYSDYRLERTGNKNYGINIEIDFEELKIGQSFFEVIPVHSLYLLSELCFNLSETFKRKQKNKIE